MPSKYVLCFLVETFVNMTLYTLMLSALNVDSSFDAIVASFTEGRNGLNFFCDETGRETDEFMNLEGKLHGT